MDEIFGRVTAILFAAAVFMGMPLLYMSERAKSAEQMYLLTVNTEFVDSICNTGFLTMEMYQQFYKETADLIQQSFIRKPIQSTLTCLRMKEMEHPP